MSPWGKWYLGFAEYRKETNLFESWRYNGLNEVVRGLQCKHTTKDIIAHLDVLEAVLKDAW